VTGDAAGDGLAGVALVIGVCRTRVDLEAHHLLVRGDPRTRPANCTSGNTPRRSPSLSGPPSLYAGTRSRCGGRALLVLAIITAIVILLAAFGLLGWIFS
jgi:hypothetical protein